MRLYSLCLAACLGLGAIALPIELGTPLLKQQAIAQTVEDRKAEGDRFLEQGFQQFESNQFQAALPLFEQAVLIYQETEVYKAFPQESRLGEAFALAYMGEAHYSLDQYPQAIERYQQALRVFQALDERDAEATTLMNIGFAQQSLGQYSPALEHYEQALFIARETNDRKTESIALNNIGELYDNQGQYPQALEQYEQALIVLREIGDRSGESVSLGNIGVIYQNLGQYSQALEQFQQALAITREVGNRTNEAIGLSNIGLVYRSLGQPLRALDYYQQALTIQQDIGDRSGESVSLNNIGVAYQSLEQYPQALNYYQQASAIAREIGYRAAEGNALGNIGVVYSAQGQYSQALDYHQQALAIAREIGDRAGEEIRLSNTGTVLLESNQYAQAEEVLFQALLVLESLRASELTDAQKISILDTQRFTYQFLQQALIAQNDPEKTLSALSVAERGRGRAFVDLLAAQQADSTLSAPPEVDEIQQIAQQQNATLVQYSVIDNDLESELYIWVVKPTGEIDFRSSDLATLEQPLSELVYTSRESIGVGNRGATVRPVPAAAQQQREAEQRQKLQQLHQLLIEPIQDLLPTNAEEPVIFIPHSELFLVPFPALMSAEGRYLIQDHTILTAPSIQVLQFTQQIGQSNGTRNRSTSADQVLVVGNPIMPILWSPDNSTSEPLPSLPGAEEEAIAISTLFNTEPLMWDEASESSVVERMQSAQVIHLATHGLLEYGNPEESGVRDFPGAIALAPDNTNDGLLTSSEILDLNLNAELVVLSACDTGRGNLTSDGVIGLSRSLISAGVPSIIVSLWAVDDNATSELMQEFYRRWQTNEQPLDKAQALRQAMLTTMQTHPDPKDWAAFTLIGERE